MLSSTNLDLSIDLSAVPRLPGFNPPCFKENHHKQQRWGIANRQRVENIEDKRQKFVTLPREKDPWKDGKTLPQATTREVYQKEVSPTVEAPAADVLEHQVLRFFCYFKEQVDESATENSRLRYCVLYYYLEDDTVHVVEPQLDNSGIPHGSLIKRHRIPRAEAANLYISPAQLRIGENLTIYGKSFHFSGCDKFTREWFSREHKDQPPDEEFPVDAFVSSCREAEKHTAKIPMTYDKQYREVMLGGGFVNKNMQQFMEKDRMVCRFYAAHDDCLTSTFERRLMTILFYLCDDTVEIRERLLPNSSRPHFPVYFRRNRLPKGKVAPVGPCDPVPAKDAYFQIKDFQVGKTLKMLDVDFFLYDADAFTRHYFSKELNIELNPPVDVSIKLPAPPSVPVPPPTGYGSEEDSLHSVDRIVPKTRIEQYKKSDKLDGKRLWFLARLVEPLQPGQVSRLFSLAFHLDDQEIMINEMSQRNAGVHGGRFLQKAQYKDERTQKPFRPEDLLIGSRVQINKHTFDIVDADSFTKRYLLTGELGDSEKDLYVVLGRLRDSMRERLTTSREMFRDLDQDKNEVITVAELRARLSRVAYDLTDQEALILASHFDQDKDGLINYIEFCNALQNLEKLQLVKSSAKRPPLGLQAGPNYVATVRKCDERIIEAEKRRKAVRQLQHLLYQQPRLIHKLTKEFAHIVSKNTVTCQQIHEALRSIGHEFPLETVERVVAYLMPEADRDAVDYIRLLQVLTITYTDMSAER